MASILFLSLFLPWLNSPKHAVWSYLGLMWDKLYFKKNEQVKSRGKWCGKISPCTPETNGPAKGREREAFGPVLLILLRQNSHCAQLYFFLRYSSCLELQVDYLLLTLIGMRQGGFTPLIILGLIFGSWIFIKNYQTFLEVKIEINWDNLTPCQAHWVL